jgi:hypothetical protein
LSSLMLFAPSGPPVDANGTSIVVVRPRRTSEMTPRMTSKLVQSVLFVSGCRLLARMSEMINRGVTTIIEGGGVAVAKVALADKQQHQKEEDADNFDSVACSSSGW